MTEPGRPAGLSASLEKGESAFAVKVDMASGVAGFVNVGDRVDVYWTGTVSAAPGAAGDEMTRLIAGNVRVVGVDQTSDASQVTEGIARAVTLAATREEVALLTQAAATGRLNLALIGAQSEMPARIAVDTNALLGLQAEEVSAPAPAEKVCTIRTRKGADVVDTPIPCTQ